MADSRGDRTRVAAILRPAEGVHTHVRPAVACERGRSGRPAQEHQPDHLRARHREPVPQERGPQIQHVGIPLGVVRRRVVGEVPTPIMADRPQDGEEAQCVRRGVVPESIPEQRPVGGLVPQRGQPVLEGADENDGYDVREWRVEIGRQADHAGDRCPLRSERSGAPPAFDAPPTATVAHRSPRGRGEVRPRPSGPCRPRPAAAEGPRPDSF